MELQEAGVKCEIKMKDGSTYGSFYFGTFQYKDKDNSYPVASVKLRNGSLGYVNLNSVLFDPAPYMTNKGEKNLLRELIIPTLKL
jgi:hypothetical protein